MLRGELALIPDSAEIIVPPSCFILIILSWYTFYFKMKFLFYFKSCIDYLLPSKYSTKSKYSNWKFIDWKCGKVQISERNGNKHERQRREEIKRRINMGNACYYSPEKSLSSHLLSKKLKVNTYKTIILPVVLYGVKLGLSRWERSTG